MDDFPITPPIIVKDTPKPRRLTKVAEARDYVGEAMRLGRRLMRLANPGVFVYVRHGRNAWRDFAPGSFIDPKGWQRITAPPNFPDAVLDFYRSACDQNSICGERG